MLGHPSTSLPSPQSELFPHVELLGASQVGTVLPHDLACCHDHDLLQPSPTHSQVLSIIPETSAPFLSPQAHSRNLTLIPDSEHLFPIMLEHSQPDWAQPDRLYLSLVSSSSLSLASSHMLPLSLSRSLCLTLLVLRLRQPNIT